MAFKIISILAANDIVIMAVPFSVFCLEHMMNPRLRKKATAAGALGLSVFMFVLLSIFFALTGCSNETPIAGNFQLTEGSSINFQTDVKVTYAHSGLYFDLADIPTTKNDRDFSDFLKVELLDDKNKSFQPEKVWDINGQKRNIVAFCNNIPEGTVITKIKIVALQDLQGTKIRWWTGSLK